MQTDMTVPNRYEELTAELIELKRLIETREPDTKQLGSNLIDGVFEYWVGDLIRITQMAQDNINRQFHLIALLSWIVDEMVGAWGQEDTLVCRARRVLAGHCRALKQYGDAPANTEAIATSQGK